MIYGMKKKIRGLACAFFAVAGVLSFSACSVKSDKRPDVPEITSLSDISGGVNELSTDDSVKYDKTDFVYYDFNCVSSPKSQNDVLVDRSIRIKAFGKSDGGVIQIAVRNEGGTDIKYAELKCSAGEKELSFKITSLLSGMSCILIEDSGAQFDEEQSYYGFELENRVDFDSHPSVHTDIFTIYGRDNEISVKNISDKTVSDVYVYYKNAENGVLVGDKTYRVSIGELLAGEEKQVSAQYFKAYSGRVLYIEYGS